MLSPRRLHRLLRLCLPLAVTLLSIAAQTQAQDTNDAPALDLATVEAQIQSTQSRLQELDAQIQENRIRKATLEKTVASVTGKVAERAARLDDLAGEIKRYNKSLGKLEAQVAHEREQLLWRKQQLANSIRRQQHLANSAGLKVILQHNNPSEASRLGVYTDYFLRAQNRAIASQLAVIDKVEQAHATALKDRNWLNHIQRKASGQHQSYVQERNTVDAEINSVAADIQSQSKTVAELKADSSRLQNLMEELEALQVASSGYFEAGRGRYPWPVKGRVEARFDQIKSVGKVRWKGLYIAADIGAAVRAIADGEVVYSDWLQGFGRLVIVDHGDSFMTLYGGSREALVRAGDWVDAGRPVATVGTSSGHKVPGLYFEIRHDAKPVDPEEWVESLNGTKTAKN